MALEKRTGAANDVTNTNMNLSRENLERLLTYLHQHCSISFEFWWDAGSDAAPVRIRPRITTHLRHELIYPLFYYESRHH
jgi:hypothetical protein